MIFFHDYFPYEILSRRIMHRAGKKYYLLFVATSLASLPPRPNNFNSNFRGLGRAVLFGGFLLFFFLHTCIVDSRNGTVLRTQKDIWLRLEVHKKAKRTSLYLLPAAGSRQQAAARSSLSCSFIDDDGTVFLSCRRRK